MESRAKEVLKQTLAAKHELERIPKRERTRTQADQLVVYAAIVAMVNFILTEE